MTNRMRRLDDLKLDVHDLTEMIEKLEESPDTMRNRILIKLCQAVREGVKQEIHDRAMVARTERLDAWKREHGERKEA